MPAAAGPIWGETGDLWRPAPAPLHCYSTSFFTQSRLRRILGLAGYPPRLGLPARGGLVGVWGHSPTAPRGQAIAARRGAAVVRVEDAFLRSLFPGRSGSPALGLVIDHGGMHYAPDSGSDLLQILAKHPLDDAALLTRARHAMARLQAAHLTKYSATLTDGPDLPAPGYVLVIDQTRGDAAITMGGATAQSFANMLAAARTDHPHHRIIIKTHPETAQGHRPGYFGPNDADARTTVLATPLSPWALLEGAVAVYTVSSQMGFEAIVEGHRPHVFGAPFYAGWGLSTDHAPLPNRQRRLTAAQLFTAAMLLYPVWYDPYNDQLCQLEQVIDTLEAQARAWREDRHGWACQGISLWKRRHMRAFFGQHGTLYFAKTAQKAAQTAQATGARHMVWASHASPPAPPHTAGHSPGVTRVEDGFLRSNGLGARLVAPLSLACDGIGIHYDPAQPSLLEGLIAQRAKLRPDQALRAQTLLHAVLQAGVSKYNIGQPPPTTLPRPAAGQPLILVPGQVENDASVLRGAPLDLRTNRALLARVRAENPKAMLIYKPHPDVEAGLRPGHVADAETWADLVLEDTDSAALLPHIDAVWTLTSLLGFEALMRGRTVVTLGAPFYTGWGLTRHLGMDLPRRSARPGLLGLVHAALIDYPRYHDPLSNQPCPPEVALARLAAGVGGRPMGWGLPARVQAALKRR